jgi:hypothetical protein
MLKLKPEEIDRMDMMYPGIREMIIRFDQAQLPVCAHCGSEDTSDVQVGLIARTIDISAATTKFKLIANGPRLGKNFCNACNKFFN